ncbi:MAG: hypothetical protein MZV65_49225 [Chromatiales bacterium]|nr:hypothetical protein [Chromatiales bacterium]
MYKRLATFGDAHGARSARTLGQSVDAYNSAVGSLERQVLPGARKFTELGLRPGEGDRGDSRRSKSCARGRRRWPAESDAADGRTPAMTDDPCSAASRPVRCAYFAVLFAPAPHARAAARGALRVRRRRSADRRRRRRTRPPTRASSWWRGEVDRLAAGRPEHPIARGAAAAARSPRRRSRRCCTRCWSAADLDLARMTYRTLAGTRGLLLSRSAGRAADAGRGGAGRRPRAAGATEREFARRLGSARAPGRRCCATCARDVAAGRLLCAARAARGGRRRSADAGRPARPGCGSDSPACSARASCAPSWPRCRRLLAERGRARSRAAPRASCSRLHSRLARPARRDRADPTRAEVPPDRDCGPRGAPRVRYA